MASELNPPGQCYSDRPIIFVILKLPRYIGAWENKKKGVK